MAVESFYALIMLALGGLLLVFGIFMMGIGLGSIPGYWFSRTIRYGDHLLTIQNNPLGIETISIDGEVILSKFAIVATHRFNYAEAEFEVRVRPKIHLLSVSVTVLINGDLHYQD